MHESKLEVMICAPLVKKAEDRLRASVQFDQSLNRALREQPRIKSVFRRTAKTLHHENIPM